MYHAAPLSFAARPALRYLIDGARGLIVIDLLEIGDAPALVSALRAIRTDAAYRPGLKVCVECGYLNRIPTSDDVRALACAYVTETNGDTTARWAIVANWACLYSAARLFTVLASTPRDRVRVFQSPDDALRWLDPVPPARKLTSWAREARALHEIARRSRFVS